MAAKKPKSVKVYELIFVVEGVGDFPLDMLRYDSAFPLTERDAYIAGHSHQMNRRVALRSRKLTTDPPNMDRWKSFGWFMNGTFDHTLEAEEFRDKCAPLRGAAGT